MFIRALITICVLFSAVFSADAQGIRPPYGGKPGRGAAQQPALEKFEGAGTIEALGTGRIQMLTGSNEKWLIGLTPKTKVQVIGQATVGFLSPGLFVQLKADVDNHGVTTDKVGELILITPSQEKPPGIFPQAAAEGVLQKGIDGTKTPATGPSIVRGRIAAFQNNKLQINIGHGTFLCELSENAKIRLDVADYSMVRKGDKITVQGLKMRGAAGQVQAMHVKIELAETLAGMTEKSPIQSKLQHRSNPAKTKQGDVLPPPKVNW